MKIIVNGEPREVADGTTVDALAGAPRGIAVAVNSVVVPAASWTTTRLVEGDAVEVVTARQGG
jgi:sulfur carrier protein